MFSMTPTGTILFMLAFFVIGGLFLGLCAFCYHIAPTSGDGDYDNERKRKRESKEKQNG